MINTNRYNVDNVRLVNRLLPWWLRGRKTILFLSAILYPMVMLHKVWQAWALEKLIEASVTSQPKSLAWYLTYKLRSHFEDTSDSFAVDSTYSTPGNYIFFRNEWRRAIDLTAPVKYLSDDIYVKDSMTVYNLDEDQVIANCIIIYAPIIVDGTYTLDDYKFEILKLALKYITNQQKIYIIYNERIIN